MSKPILHKIEPQEDNYNNTNMQAAYERNYQSYRNSVLYQLLHTAVMPVGYDEDHKYLITNTTNCPIILENGCKIAKEYRDQDLKKQ